MKPIRSRRPLALASALLLASAVLLLCQRPALALDEFDPYQFYEKVRRYSSGDELLDFLGRDAFERLRAEYANTKRWQLLELIALTRHPDARAFLLQQLAEPGTLDTSESARIRTAAIQGLRHMQPDGQTARAVAALLAEKARWIRESAADALYEMHHPASEEALIAFAAKDRPGQDSKPLRTLARIGTPAAIELIRTKMDRRQAYMPWYGSLAEELAHLERRELVPLWIEALRPVAERGNSCDDDLIKALGLLRDARAVPVLSEIVRKRTFRFRYWAAWSLGRIGDRSALPALVEGFGKVKDYPASPLYVNQAVISYARAALGDPEGERFLRELASDEDPLKRMHAWTLLLQLGHDEMAEKIGAAYQKYKDIKSGCPRYRNERVVEALLESKKHAVRELLSEMAEYEGANNIAYTARRALARFPYAERAQALSVRMRQANLARCQELARKLLALPGDPFPYFAELLSSGELAARLSALRILGLFAPERYKAQIARAQKDPAWQVALEARWLLGRKKGDFHVPARQVKTEAYRPGDLWGYHLDIRLRPGRYDPLASKADPTLDKNSFQLLELPDGRMAAATGGGLKIYDGMQWKTLGEEQGLCSDESFGLALRGGKLVVAGMGGLAVQGKAGRFRCLKTSQQPYCLASDPAGRRLFVGTDSGVLELVRDELRPLPGAGGPTDPVSALAVSADSVWAAIGHNPRKKQEEPVKPRLFGYRRGKWTAYGEPFQHFFGGRKRDSAAAVLVYDIDLDRSDRLYIGTSWGLMRFDGKRFENLSALGGRAPWTAVRSVAVEAGRVYAGGPGFVEVLERGRWRRAVYHDQSEEEMRRYRMRLEERGRASTAILADRAGGLWLMLNQEQLAPRAEQRRANTSDPAAALQSAMSWGLLRYMDSDRKRRALPPDTLVASIAGGVYVQNEDVDLSPPNEVRRFQGGKTLDLPSAAATITAVAKDPWDYASVEYRFKLDDNKWSAWSDKNTLITPKDLPEGAHTVRVQSRDADGHVDPSPAEVGFRLRPRELSIVKIHNGEFQRIFPSQYPRYLKVGLGKVRLENRTTLPMELEIELEIEGWSEPTRTPVKLASGETRWVPVMASLSSKALGNTGARSVQALVTAHFVHDDVKRTQRKSFAVELLEGNAFCWDEPERLAAFVNGRDPRVESLAAEIFRHFSKDHPEQARPAHPLHNHLLALYAFGSLASAGIRYKPDAKRPFASLKTGALDTVQYPSQTLERKVGDCDDLTVLLASVLEGLNVPTAIVPVEGHVFMLYDTGVRQENRSAFPVDARKTALRSGTLWVPVETTVLGKSHDFSQAVVRGASQLHAKYKPDAGRIFDVELAWEKSPPATLPASGEAVPRLRLAQAKREAEGLLAAYGQSVEKIAGQGEDPAALLARGEALVKSGMFARAAEIYEQAVKAEQSYRALYGLGAARAGAGEMLMALVSFQKALAKAQGKKARFQCQLAIAQCYKVDGNLSKAKQHLDEALALNPAARFDTRTRQLMDYLQQAGGAKASGEEAGPPFFQEILLGL
ncbi:MAG: hypothetical protein JXR96_22485 [Deltaproteobacteria bacterium]|nr:hypothetical protein [Deltaproteobacteria bacterium]